MRVETGIAPEIATAAEQAQRAEALGYDGVITPETTHDPFFPLLMAAEHTERISIGTGVAISFPRSPMVVANIAWDLQGYSGGRFKLGLGSQVKGHNQRRFSVEWTPPGPRMREYVLALKAIWHTWATGDKLDFQGEHYNFTLMTPNFTPPPIEHPDIPVYISAVGPVMCRVAGEVCDGLRMHGFLTPKYMTDVILPNVEKGLAKTGRTWKDFDLVGGGFAAIGDTDEEIRKAKQQIATQISFYGSTRTYQGVFDVHGWGDLTSKLHEMSLAGEWGAMSEVISDDVLETFAVVGKPEDAATEIVKRYGEYCGSVGFGMPTPNADEEDRARRIIDGLHAAGA
jgi:probable F420-dependent oxidoreductase